MVPAHQKELEDDGPGGRKGHLSQQQLQLGGETLAMTVPLPCLLPLLLGEKIFFPDLLFSDDSFTPAFHFNDSIAVKLSHIKA